MKGIGFAQLISANLDYSLQYPQIFGNVCVAWCSEVKYAPFTDRQLIEMIVPMPEELGLQGIFVKHFAREYVEKSKDFPDLISNLEKAEQKAHGGKRISEQAALYYIKTQVKRVLQHVGEHRYDQVGQLFP